MTIKNMRNGQTITSADMLAFFKSVFANVNGLLPKHIKKLTMRCFRFRRADVSSTTYYPDNIDQLLNTSSVQWTNPYKDDGSLSDYMLDVNMMKRFEDDIETIENM